MNQELNCPQGFIVDEYVRSFEYSETELDLVWKKIQRRETFTKGQIFPYEVKFASDSQEGEFHPHELNIHHGPLLSLHGAIGEVTPNYRSLDYFYGSYVLSFRLVRPIKLEFFREDTILKLKLRTYVRPWFKVIWHLGNIVSWSIFKKTM